MGADRKRKPFASTRALLALGGSILPFALVPSVCGQILPPSAPIAATADPSGAPLEVNNAALPAGDPQAASPSGDVPATSTPDSSCCPPLPAEAPGSVASDAAIEGAGAETAAAAAQSLLRSPGLTPVPAARRMAPPPPPSPTAVADTRNWKAIDAAGIQVIDLGEFHLDPAMLQKEGNFLQSAYTHGFRNLVIEYPKNEQGALNRYLNSPSYPNMANALYPFYGLPSANAQQRAQDVTEAAIVLEAVEQNPQKTLQTDRLTKAQLALIQANMQMARNWLAAHRMGIAVEGADVARNVGLDKQTGQLVFRNPSDQQIYDYLTSATGIADRNKTIARAAAMSLARGGRTIVTVGSAHTGFLPNERLHISVSPGESYPGIDYLLQKNYHVASVAVAQSQITPQGYLAESADPNFSAAHMTIGQMNQRSSADLAQDPFRSPIEPSQPIEQSLSDAVARREKALPQIH